jgi:hypothetical protein
VRGWRLSAPFAMMVLLYGLSPVAAHADSAQILKEITDTATGLCGEVAQSGHADTIKATGDVKAELSGLAKRLANLGVSGTGEINSTEYQGVVQQQLAATLQDVRNCKITIFNTLQQKLLPDAASPPQQPTRDPNALYQYGEPVADVQGAVISQANGTVTFQVIRSSGKANPAREVEYQNWVLSCPHIPAPPPNTYVGQFNGMAVGETCTIVRKISQ